MYFNSLKIMRYLRTFLVMIYVVLIILLLLRSCNNEATNDTLSFRTVDGQSYNALPDCDLDVYVNGEVLSHPDNSGNGIFGINGLSNGDVITIIASKDGYETNNYTVNEAVVGSLLGVAHIDIPLRREVLPCNAKNEGRSNVDANSVFGPISYDMGVSKGHFDFIYETGGSCPDCIEIYNHGAGENPLSGAMIFSSGMVATGTQRCETLEFSNGNIVSVVVTTGYKSSSMWNYEISCPY